MQATKFLALLALVAGCSDDAAPQGPAAERVQLPGATFYPEGLSFDHDGNMYVSSILTGALAKVPAGSDAAIELVPGNRLGASLVASAMSRRGDLLWLCLGTYGTDVPPAVIGILTDGTEVVRHLFPKQADGRTGGLCNEITEDGQGNIYASDSFGARILKIPADKRTTANSAAVWASSPDLGAQMFGVNGIAWDGKQSILAVNTETGKLFRVGLADAALTQVTLERNLAGPDGIRRISDTRAVVVEQGAGRVSSIDLATGKITSLKEDLRTPTSLDVIGDEAWVSEGQLSHIFDQTMPELPFYVVRVAL